MSAYTTLLYSNTFNVITIALKRPESYEVQNEAMKKELNKAFKRSEKDEGVW